MPIYEYECTACDYTQDVLQKMTDAPLTHCPQCAQHALKKCVSAPAFKLKGSGWYETDFKGGQTSDAKSKTHAAATDKTDKGQTTNSQAATKPSTQQA